MCCDALPLALALVFAAAGLALPLALPFAAGFPMAEDNDAIISAADMFVCSSQGEGFESGNLAQSS